MLGFLPKLIVIDVRVSSSGGSTSNPVTVPEQPKNGSISVSPSNASEGQTVTVTVTLDDGYGVQTVTVTDKKGNNIPVTPLGNNKCSFTMPGTAVTIEATLVPLSGSVTFTDVPANAYYADAVTWAVRNCFEAPHVFESSPFTLLILLMVLSIV